jgi:HAD superfamily hydrolase (TIGR01484 family)
MAKSYEEMTTQIARQIKLIMTDVDGTLLEDGDEAIPSAAAAIRQMESLGITVGLVSGRHMGKLDDMARELAIDGPIIAENGGLAKLHVDEELFPLGYTREAGLKTFNKLKSLFSDSIRGREDNADRLIDVVFYSNVLSTEELQEHIDGDVQLLDSGYIRHLMQKGITKGKTLQTILNDGKYAKLDPEEVMVLGDSSTDISLFELFPNSVLIPNPNLPDEQTQRLRTICRYESDLPFGEGFAQVADHIIKLREA